MYIDGHTWTYMRGVIDGRVMVIGGHSWSYVLIIMQMCPEIELLPLREYQEYPYLP